MKKLALFLVMVLCAMSFCAFADEEVTLAGGWMNNETPAEYDETALAAFNKAFEEFVGSNVEPVALLGTQVVAGINYCWLCKVTPVVPNAVCHYALVYIYAGLDGEATVLTITDIDIAAMYEASMLDEE